MTWKDCFGRELKEGEDVVVALPGTYWPEMHSGIIISLDDEECLLSYNSWKGDEEVVKEKTLYKDVGWEVNGDSVTLTCIYKIF